MLKFVSVTDADGMLKPYAARILDAIAYFKGEHDSIQQAATLLESEFERWKRVGPDEYSPTQLTMALLNEASAKASAVVTTGYVGLALWGMKGIGEKPSLTCARKGVAKFFEDFNRVPFTFWDAEERRIEERLVSLPSSERAVRTAFDQHRKAVHICAARVVANVYLEPSALFVDAPLAIESYVATAAALQHFISEFDNTDRDSRSNPIEPYLFGWNEKFQTSCPPLEPTIGLMEPLMAACGFPNSVSG